MKLETSKSPRSDATYLQGVASYVTGTPAGDIRPGDNIVFNGGEAEQVQHIVQETPKTVTMAFTHPYNDSDYITRRFKKSRIVARPLDEIRD